MRKLLIALLVLACLTMTSTDTQAHEAFGPLHRYLYQTAPYPWLQDQIIQCESGWDSEAYNGIYGASGLAQFLPSTWAWGEELFGYMGPMWDPYAQIDMMNAFAEAGMLHHWSCYYVVTQGWNPG